MRFLNERVLGSLKSVGLSAGNPFPARGEWRTSGFQTLKIRQPGKTRLRDEASRHTHLARHLIRAVRNAARISGARRYCAGTATTCFILCREFAQHVSQSCAQRSAGSSGRVNRLCRNKVTGERFRVVCGSVGEIDLVTNTDLVGVLYRRIKLK